MLVAVATPEGGRRVRHVGARHDLPIGTHMTHPAAPVGSWARHLPAGIDPASVDVLEEESLPRAWRARWSEAPTAVVAIDEHGTQITAEQLEDRSRTVAGRLAGAGLVAGDRLVFSGVACLDLLVAYVAAHRLGLTIVPVNTAYGADEIAHIVRNTAPKAALVDDSRRRPGARAFPRGF